MMTCIMSASKHVIGYNVHVCNKNKQQLPLPLKVCIEQCHSKLQKGKKGIDRVLTFNSLAGLA